MSQEHAESGRKGYVIGFVASVILTIIPFYLAANHLLPGMATYVVLLVCAVVQVMVHLVYFLHMETHTLEGRWNLISMIFAIVVVVIVIGGSVWIMWNLNVNMAM